MFTTKIQLNTIEEAIEDIRQGKIIIVVDDEGRENEGDFVAAAEKVTPEMINFMATHGRGLICAPMTEKRCKELGLTPMVHNNTDPMETAFTVSVDLRGISQTWSHFSSNSQTGRCFKTHWTYGSCHRFCAISRL